MDVEGHCSWNNIPSTQKGTKEKMNSNVVHYNAVNLSCTSPSDFELQVLSRGLSFSPTCHFDLFFTLLDVNIFTINVLLRKYLNKDVSVECVHKEENKLQIGSESECMGRPGVTQFEDLYARLTLEQLYVESFKGGI